MYSYVLLLCALCMCARALAGLRSSYFFFFLLPPSFFFFSFFGALGFAESRSSCLQKTKKSVPGSHIHMRIQLCIEKFTTFLNVEKCCEFCHSTQKNITQLILCIVFCCEFWNTKLNCQYITKFGFFFCLP